VVLERFRPHLLGMIEIVRYMLGEAAKRSVLFDNAGLGRARYKVAGGDDDGAFLVAEVHLELNQVRLVLVAQRVIPGRHLHGQPERASVASLQMLVLLQRAQDFGRRGLVEIA
jgi:hypothetical protein